MVVSKARQAAARRVVARELPSDLLLQAAVTAVPMRLLAALELAAFECSWGFECHRFDRLEATRGKPAVIVANHISMVDPWVVGRTLAPLWARDFRWLPWQLADKKVYFGNRWLSTIFWTHRCVPMNREASADDKWLTMDRCAALVSSGRRMLIFAEGTRSRTGRLAPFKPGAAAVALAVPGCVVIPLYHRGAEEIMPVGSKWLRRGPRVRVWIGEPLEASRYSSAELLTDDLHRQMTRMEAEAFATARRSHLHEVAP